MVLVIFGKPLFFIEEYIGLLMAFCYVCMYGYSPENFECESFKNQVKTIW